MAGFTNKGKYRLLETLRGVSLPTNMYVALCTSAATPSQDSDTLSEMTQIGTSTGYTSGGISLNMDTTDWSAIVEDDTNDDSELTIKDLVWTASGGTLGAARYAVLTDDNATEGDREIWAYYDLGSDQSASSGQTLTLSGFILKLAE